MNLVSSLIDAPCIIATFLPHSSPRADLVHREIPNASHGCNAMALLAEMIYAPDARFEACISFGRFDHWFLHTRESS